MSLLLLSEEKAIFANRKPSNRKPSNTGLPRRRESGEAAEGHHEEWEGGGAGDQVVWKGTIQQAEAHWPEPGRVEQ